MTIEPMTMEEKPKTSLPSQLTQLENVTSELKRTAGVCRENISTIIGYLGMGESIGEKLEEKKSDHIPSRLESVKFEIIEIREALKSQNSRLGKIMNEIRNEAGGKP